jgi:Cys-rich protein (TIGR01571 family)
MILASSVAGSVMCGFGSVFYGFSGAAAALATLSRLDRTCLMHTYRVWGYHAGFLTTCLHYPVRKAFKQHHGITESPGPCPDLALLLYCDPCAVCQARAMRRRTREAARTAW